MKCIFFLIVDIPLLTDISFSRDIHSGNPN
jgi:hypothetical protein